MDAFFWVGGLPTSAVTDLGATPGVKIKLIDHAESRWQDEFEYGNLYAGSTIKAGTYPGQTTDNKNTVVWNILVSNAKMSGRDADNIVKIISTRRRISSRCTAREELLVGQPGKRVLADPVASRRNQVHDRTRREDVARARS